jgi:Derlin-2/3
MTPEEWFNSIPFVTKRWFIVVQVCMLLATFNLMNMGHLALYWPYIRFDFQIWRFFTAYFFFGDLSIMYFMTMGVFLQFGRGLEGEYFSASGRHRMNYIWCLFLGWLLLTPLFLFIFPSYFPGPYLLTFIGYVWSRKDPFRPISFYGFTLKQWHTPLICIFLDLCNKAPIVPTFCAILVGHFVHMMLNMVPKRYGVDPFGCPEVLLNFGEKYLQEHSVPNVDTPVQPAQDAPQPSRPVWARGTGNRLD